MNIYFISPSDWDKQMAFGFFKFEPCECGCAKTYGWGFNFFLFGFNFTTRKLKEAK